MPGLSRESIIAAEAAPAPTDEAARYQLNAAPCCAAVSPGKSAM